MLLYQSVEEKNTLYLHPNPSLKTKEGRLSKLAFFITHRGDKGYASCDFIGGTPTLPGDLITKQ